MQELSIHVCKYFNTNYTGEHRLEYTMHQHDRIVELNPGIGLESFSREKLKLLTAYEMAGHLVGEAMEALRNKQTDIPQHIMECLDYPLFEPLWPGDDDAADAEVKAGITYVYVIAAHNYIKIGVSVSPQQRLYVLQCGCPFKLEILTQFTIKGPQRTAYSLEKELHKHYAEYATHGEWFNLPSELLDELLKVEVLTKDAIKKLIK
jgi:hypothetical protein